MYNILQLNEMLVPDLRDIAEKLDVKGFKRLTKKELIYKIVEYQTSGPSDDELSEQLDSQPNPKPEVENNSKKERFESGEEIKSLKSSDNTEESGQEKKLRTRKIKVEKGVEEVVNENPEKKEAKENREQRQY